MATWEDGPEYAPVERPDAFAEPVAGAGVGLAPPPPLPVPPSAPVERPAFADPAQAVPPLAALVPEPPDVRDPGLPFAVVSSVMTADTSAWASAHWAPPQPAAAPQQAAALPPPSYPPPSPAPFPAPGTPQWFTPGGYAPPPPPPAPPNARTVLAAATPGVLVTLLVGAFIWVLAPVTLILSYLLASRVTYGRKAVRTALAAVLAFLGLVSLIAIVTADGLFSDWWNTLAGWGCFGSWVALVTTVVIVYRALQRGIPDPPPPGRR